jgi:hypothetical protein
VHVDETSSTAPVKTGRRKQVTEFQNAGNCMMNVKRQENGPAEQKNGA